MREKLKKEITDYLQSYVKEIRLEKKLTQEEMAERMCMATRNYVELEHCKSSLSLVTFSLLLNELDETRYDVVEDIISIIKNMKSE